MSATCSHWPGQQRCDWCDLGKEKKGRWIVLRYVRLESADDYVRLGWVPTNALEGTHHEQWSVMMQWICEECEPVEPIRNDECLPIS